MGHYAMLVPAYTGHLNPMLALGRAMAARGHRVSVISPCAAQAKVQRAGLDFIPFAEPEFPLGEWARLMDHSGEQVGMAATRAAVTVIARMARAVQRDLPAIAARERLDGLVMDQIAVGTEGVCQVLGLPLAVGCAALSLHIESRVPPPLASWPYRTALPLRVRNTLAQFWINLTGLPAGRVISGYRFRHGLPMMGFHYINELRPSLVQVTQQPAFFDYPRRALPDHFHYTAPWVEDEDRGDSAFPWERLDGRPLIYASLGTIQNRLTPVFRTIAEACAGLDAQLVIALGNRGATLPADLPGAPLVVDYAPQVALVRRASLVITHAGLNTTLETLRAGVPMVALPISNDQPGVAARLRHLGLGEFIPVRAATAGALRELVVGVLNTPAYRERAQQRAAELRRLDGPAMAAELIETAFVTRQRVRRTVAAVGAVTS